VKEVLGVQCQKKGLRITCVFGLCPNMLLLHHSFLFFPFPQNMRNSLRISIMLKE
jgi:hypothetical protein